MSTEQQGLQVPQDFVFEIKLGAPGVNAVISALGKMETSAGVWPLMQHIIQQVQEQIPASDEQPTQ